MDTFTAVTVKIKLYEDTL